jgi:hypothetical protein
MRTIKQVLVMKLQNYYKKTMYYHYITYNIIKLYLFKSYAIGWKIYCIAFNFKILQILTLAPKNIARKNANYQILIHTFSLIGQYKNMSIY